MIFGAWPDVVPKANAAPNPPNQAQQGAPRDQLRGLSGSFSPAGTGTSATLSVIDTDRVIAITPISPSRLSRRNRATARW